MGTKAGGRLHSRVACLFAAPIRGSTGDNFHNVWREFENGDLGIISILYERMNLSLRLKEDLAALSRKQP
ncbi:hypothetical protein IE4771_PE00036 (plasmid) [Rhizobium etli bv. mimosae str. IE4771]|uniref:Uncharacterized protein n=1 Tax=Rhizobium etli bv. mimosae str. IE4771 TaxID=1432050 RepID=A0A060IBY5_RHIET|nr:hypothetical protein IE4771_PE00036 [Rhizobium sp. IE4771]